MVWLGLSLLLLGVGGVLLFGAGAGSVDRQAILARFGFGDDRDPATRDAGRARTSPRGFLVRDKEFSRALAQLGWSGPGGNLGPYAIWLLAIGTGAVAGTMLGLIGGGSVSQLGFAGLAGAAVGLIGFKRLVLWRAARRMARIKAELPLSIRLLRLLLNSGLAYEMAFKRIAEEGEAVVPELGRELDRVLRRTAVGMPLAQSLSVMQERLDDPDVSRLIGILAQLISLGGSVDRSLINLAEDLEKRRESAMREAVNKAAGKMSLIMMLFLFPALLIVLAGPAIISLAGGLLEISS